MTRTRTAVLAAALLLLALAFGVHAPHDAVARPAAGALAPSFALPRLGGGALDTTTLSGRVVVLNFWATWCGPCLDEMPSLERLHRALSSQGLVVVAVAADESAVEVEAFAKRYGLTLTVLHDRGGRQAARLYGVAGYPETVIVGRDGRVVHRAVGPARWDSPEAVEYFRGLMGARR